MPTDSRDPATERSEYRIERERAYRAARYRVATPDGGHVLMIGRPAPAFAGWLGTGGFRSATVLTACNPGSRPLPDAENTRRRQELETAVAAQGLSAWPAVNQDPSGQWPDEPGLCIADLPASLLDAWLERFGQNAAVVYEPPAAPRLVWHPALRPQRPAG